MNDDLSAARGIFHGIIGGLLMWVVIYLVWRLI